MIKKFLSVAFVGLLLISCKESNTEAQIEETTPVTEAVQSETPTQSSDAVQVQAESVVQPQQNTNVGPIIQQQQQQAPTTGQTAPGWSGKPNPPHGQEGHRCDIQVGDILP